MEKPYLINSLIGNSKMLVTLDVHGQIQRLWWPYIDHPQHVSQFMIGVFVDGKIAETSWLHGYGWEHSQRYLEDTAIVETTCINHYLGLEVRIRDFCPYGQDLLVRSLEVKNIGETPIPVRIICLSSLDIAESTRCNTVYFEPEVDGMIHYGSGYYFAIAGDWVCSGYQAGGGIWDAGDGRLEGNPLGMGTDGALTWDLGNIDNGQQEAFTLYLTAGNGVDAVMGKAEQARSKGWSHWYEETRKYWIDYLGRGKAVNLKNPTLLDVYKRSLMTFKLLSDEEHGGIMAAPEIDEHYNKCGGYGYCWGRDAAYITVAMEKAGYQELARNFYRWAVMAQSPNGSWHQRHFMNGHYAPSWGFQVDETGSILWGIWQHYLLTRDEAFAQETYPCVERAAEFLMGFQDVDTGLPKPSYDLWEERVGEHSYSSAAVFGGMMGAAQMAEAMGKTQQALQWRKFALKLKEAVETLLWSEEHQRFLRSLKKQIPQVEFQEREARGERVAASQNSKGYYQYSQWVDDTIDVSLLGIAVPFGLLGVEDKRVQKTAEVIEERLRSPIAGIMRYEHDPYMGGNPWLLTTMWMGLYYCRVGLVEKARDMLMWAVDKRTDLSLLPEQADKHTGQPAWVVPLTWSHAMFVLLVWELIEKGIDL